jgi:tetratricopeptide (TPR) repeat protein
MRKRLFAAIAVFGLSTTAFAHQPQQPAQQQPGQQAQQPAGPKPKSQKEVDALQKVQQATDPEARIAAIENVLENFSDTEYKLILLEMATQSAQQANDLPKVIVYGERTLQADPKNATAELAIASATVQNTKEFDLDKEQKLTKADKDAHDAIDSLKTAPAPNPQMTDAQWQESKKQMTAEAYATLGASASLRKKYDQAVTYYKTAADTDASPVILARLAHAYNQAKQPDNAITTSDRVLAMSDAPPAVKSFVQQEKAQAEKAKGGGASTSPAPAAPAPPAK